MYTPPQIVVILRADGSITDVSVFAKDHRARVLGFHVIEALTEEIEIFEARAKLRLEQTNAAN